MRHSKKMHDSTFGKSFKYFELIDDNLCYSPSETHFRNFFLKEARRHSFYKLFLKVITTA